MYSVEVFTNLSVRSFLPIAIKMLRFAALSSDIELPFYISLAFHKLNHDKLDDSTRRVLGLYEIRPLDLPDTSCRMQLHGNALTNDMSVFHLDQSLSFIN